MRNSVIIQRGRPIIAKQLRRITWVLLSAVPVFLSACSSMQSSDLFVNDDQLLETVVHYRQRLARDPADAQARLRLHDFELRAADYYYHNGQRLLEQGDRDGAIAEFQKGLIAKPDLSKLLQAMKDALAQQESQALYLEALRNAEAGKSAEAFRILQRALAYDPSNAEVQKTMALLRAESAGKSNERLDSQEHINLSFRETNLREAFEFIAKAFDINILFDTDTPSSNVTLYAKNLTFDQSLSLMMGATKTFYKRLGPNTLLISPDTKEKRGQYEDYRVKTFHLRAISAKTMAALLKSVLTLKRVTVNEELNVVIVRDNADTLALVEKVIDANDRKPAEMLLEVQIIEVDRTKTEQLGFNFGSQISLKFEPFSAGSSWAQALQSGVVTLPSLTFHYFMQDVDAQILANPKIRVLDDKSAKILIGERVPLRTSTILDATGQTRTTFEYRNIGISLAAQPDIHLDNSSTVKLGLEVSALGQNLGTPDEPAYSILTRNADTEMLLRDGETAVLGGLIRDEDRSSRVMVPGLGQIPAVGVLFTAKDDQLTRTDVLLTITPHVIRPWELPPKSVMDFYSGTQDHYSTRPSLDLSVAEQGKALVSHDAAQDSAFVSPLKEKQTPPTAVQQDLNARAVNLHFAQEAYSVAKGETLTVELLAQNLIGVQDLPILILSNSDLLAYTGGQVSEIDGAQLKLEDQGAGRIALHLSAPQGLSAAQAPLARLHFKALKAGVSYLVFDSTVYQGDNKGAEKPQVHATRVLIK